MTEFRGIIYKARNIVNGKIYIGYSTKQFEIRRNEHIKDSFKEKRSYIFQAAIKKYTYHNFHWEILDRTAKNLKELKQLEIKYIAEHNSYYLDGHGYNMTRGGEGFFQKGDNKFNNPIIAKKAKEATGRTKETHPYLAENGKKAAEKIRGRTSQTHEYIKISADKQRGRTKETHPGIAIAVEKRKGRNKDNHPGVARISEFRTGKTKKDTLFVQKQIETYKKTCKDPNKNSKILLSYKKMAETNTGKTKYNDLGKAKQSLKISGKNNPMSKENRAKRGIDLTGDKNPMTRANMDKRSELTGKIYNLGKSGDSNSMSKINREKRRLLIENQISKYITGHKVPPNTLFNSL